MSVVDVSLAIMMEDTEAAAAVDDAASTIVETSLRKACPTQERVMQLHPGKAIVLLRMMIVFCVLLVVSNRPDPFH